ncbi:MAG: ATP-binding protein [Methylobacterium sp.]|nr:ATP-binding protein [Methylobacterium sp.]
MADRIGPVTFAWMNSEGREFFVRPIITKGKIDFPSTEEEMPDFFYFSSNSPTGSVDVATRFSELRRNGGIQLLNQAIGSAFPWIRDMQVEVIAGSPILYADDARRNVRLPVAMMSGAVNRTLAILLSIAARKNAVVLVDEMENGIFYKNYRTIWAAIIGFCKTFNTQLFTTTHSLEWLRALFDENPNDLKDLIAVWRVEQDLEGPQIYPFSGSVAADIIDFGSDLRSGADNE